MRLAQSAFKQILEDTVFKRGKTDEKYLLLPPDRPAGRKIVYFVNKYRMLCKH